MCLETVPWRQQQQHATIQELEDDATAAAFLAGGTQKQSSMSIPIGSALGAGGLPFDPTLPPALQKYSRQVMSRSNSDAFIGPASVVNPYTGFMPASASQAPTAAQAQAPQIVRLPINMEIERNKAAAGKSSRFSFMFAEANAPAQTTTATRSAPYELK